MIAKQVHRIGLTFFFLTSTSNVTRRVFRPVRRAKEIPPKEYTRRSNYNEKDTNRKIRERRTRINEIWSTTNKKSPEKSEITQEIEGGYININ